METDSISKSNKFCLLPVYDCLLLLEIVLC